MVSAKKSVVVLGASFAGLETARRLKETKGVDVTVVDRSPWFEFIPNIHEIVSGVEKARNVRLDRRTLVSKNGQRFVEAAVTEIDVAKSRVVVEGGVLDYDVLVVALGGTSSMASVEGAETHAIGLRSADQAVQIRNRLRKLLDTKKNVSVVIVGGGYVGVEVLGEVLRRHRDKRHLSLTIVEPAERLANGLPRGIDKSVRRFAKRHGVDVRTGEAIVSVAADHVVCRSGATVRSDLTIWTAGLSPTSLLADSGLAQPGFFAPVLPSLQSRMRDDVFVVGDASRVFPKVAKQAYQATAMGRHVGTNVSRALAGRSLASFARKEDTFLITFGDLTSFLVVDDVLKESAVLGLGRRLLLQREMARLDGTKSRAARRRLTERWLDSLTPELLPAMLRPDAWLADWFE